MKRLISVGIVFLMSFYIGNALSQTTFPQKPVRLLVGFATGGFTDTVGRLVGQQLSVLWHEQVVVENRPGANGLIAGEVTSKSPPDGYTLFMSSAGLTTNPMLYSKKQRDPLLDFTAISLVSGIPNVLVTHPGVPVKNIRQLLDLAKKQPGVLTQASAGMGSPGHLSGELLQQMSQVRFIHIPYKGSGPALVDLLGGHIDLSFPSISACVPQVKARQLRAIGVTMRKTSVLLPDVEPIGKTVPGYEVVGWYGVVGPAGMGANITQKISRDIVSVVKMPEVQDRLAREGAEPIGNNQDEFARFIHEDHEKWSKVIKAAKIKPMDS